MCVCVCVCNGRITIEKLQWVKDKGWNKKSIAGVVWLPNLYSLCFVLSVLCFLYCFVYVYLFLFVLFVLVYATG